MSNSPDHLLVVQAQIKPEVENDWNEWYNEVHLPEILDCPGFNSATRYVSDVDGVRNYITIYALDSEDALKSKEFSSRRGWYEFKPSVTASVHTYKKIHEGSKSND